MIRFANILAPRAPEPPPAAAPAPDIIERMATLMLDREVEHGHCTDADLRQAGFSTVEIACYAKLATLRAGRTKDAMLAAQREGGSDA